MKTDQKPGQSIAIEWLELQRTLTLQEEPVLHYKLRVPQLAGKGHFIKRINRYYHKLFTLWQQYFEKKLYLLACYDLVGCRDDARPFDCWDGEVRAQAQLFANGLCSVRLDCLEARAKKKTVRARTCDLWQVKDGSAVPLSKLMAGKRWRRDLLAQLEAAGSAAKAGGLFLDDDYLPKLRKYFRAENFLLSPEGLCVFFDQCTIAPGVEGVITLPVSDPGCLQDWVRDAIAPAREAQPESA